MTEDNKLRIGRESWIEHFKRGYDVGQQERHREPEDRRTSVSNVIDIEDHSGPEVEALQAGYEFGRDEWYPGADLDVTGEANTTFDRSGFAPGLSAFVREEDQ